MAKEKNIGNPPVPTPRQLRNSIEALTEINPQDKRVDKYQGMIPEAEEKFQNWEKKRDRIKKTFS